MPRFVTGELQFGPRGGACVRAGHPLHRGQPGAEAVKHVLGATRCGRSHGNARGLGGAAPQAALMENVCRQGNQRAVWRAGWKKRLISVVSCAQRDTRVTACRVPFVFVASAKCRSQISLSSKLPASVNFQGTTFFFFFQKRLLFTV